MAQEKNFENRIKSFLRSEGIYRLGTSSPKMTVEPCGYYEKRHGNVNNGSGKADLHIVVNGRSVDIEVKAEKGKATDLQNHLLKQVNDCGGIGFSLYPNNFDNFKEFIIGLKNV